jgi:nucleoside-diphosphate-sugar epimerase
MTGFCDGRRVMVTSGAGFLGSAVARRIREAGAAEVFVPLVEGYACASSLTSTRPSPTRHQDHRPHGSGCPERDGALARIHGHVQEESTWPTPTHP